MNARRKTPLTVVILAAGKGTRLGRDLPKPLTELADGRTIMSQQLDNIAEAFGPEQRVTIVVGYRADEIVERTPAATLVYNPDFDTTNTSKSLLRALRSTRGPVLWMNGDVVFDPIILDRAAGLIAAGQSFVSVNRSRVADEEVKYTLSADGHIDRLSKTVSDGLGEAVGINFIASGDRRALEKQLAAVDDQDYFERGLELAIGEAGIKVQALDISDLYAVEVDFPKDLVRADAAAAAAAAGE
jgi:choline kinase